MLAKFWKIRKLDFWARDEKSRCVCHVSPFYRSLFICFTLRFFPFGALKDTPARSSVALEDILYVLFSYFSGNSLSSEPKM